MRQVLAGLFLWLAAMAGQAADLQEVRLGDARRYLFAMPAGATHAPLILALHGGGGSPGQFARDSDLADVAVGAGFAIAFPAGSSRRGIGPLTWNGGYCCGYAQAAGVDDLGFLDRVAADAASRFGVGGDRVYVTGMSNGAILAQTYAAARPGRVAAVASVAGTMDLSRVRPKGPVALLHVHGTGDGQVPYAGGVGPDSWVGTDFSAAEDVVAAFRRAQGVMLHPVADRIDPARDGMHVMRTRWLAPGGAVRVELLTVVGGGHHWPGGRRSSRRGATRDISASREVVAFFASHHKAASGQSREQQP
jgi:polyhydroxybutyrate depolymerase